jgi:PEP-CTERM motif
MKLSPPWLCASLFLAILSLNSARPALGDSYTIVDLGDANGHGIYGIDTAGDVVIWGSSGCGTGVATCYVTYADGVATSDSATAPNLAYNDGTSCGAAPAGFNVAKSVCDDGWEGIGTLYNPNGDPNGVYFGVGSDLEFIHTGSADQVFLNSTGDFAWTDGQSEEMYELIQTVAPQTTEFAAFHQTFEPATTPEPASYLLLGTGLAFATAAIRRKARR